MVICHVGLHLGNPKNVRLWTFCDICGSEFAAPIFMFLMGISMVYSKHQTPIELLKRGIKLFIMGYILSFFRSILPLFILGNVNEWTTIEAFFVVDILQFAGLTFMFISLLKKFKIPNIAILIISLIMVAIDQFLMLPKTVSFDNQILIGIINLFCPITSWSCFPFLTWFSFPAFGLVFGDILIHCTNKDKLYCILLPIGLMGVLYVYYQFYCLYPNYTSYYFGNNFYYMGIKNVLLTLFFIFFALAFWYFIGKLPITNIKKYLTFLSKNITIFYIFSWIVISILAHHQGVFKWNLSALVTILMMVIIIIVCSLLTKLWLMLKVRFNNMRDKQHKET